MSQEADHLEIHLAIMKTLIFVYNGMKEIYERLDALEKAKHEPRRTKRPQPKTRHIQLECQKRT